MTARRSVHTFDRDVRHIQRARHAVAGQLRAWGLGSEQGPIELIVSELFTNAVCHGAGAVEIRMSAEADVIRIEVRDGGGGRPVLRPADPTGQDPGGWGLQLVDQLAQNWGVVVGNGRTLVWAERAIGQPVHGDSSVS